MVKLLIVDDEEEIRNGIRSIISWESNGIVVCGEAENGRKALELVDQLSPDILLIDIRMPILDGLQVIESLYVKSSPVKSIVLSGYDDFIYAQKALRFGSSEYLLKPCRPQEILDTVLKVKKRIEDEKEQIENLNLLKLQFNESLPLLKEKFLIKLILGSVQNISDIIQNFILCKVDLTPEAASVAVLKIDDYVKFCSQRPNADTELMKFAIKATTARILSSKLRCEVFDNSDEIIAIANTSSNMEKELLNQLLEDVRMNICSSLGFTISIGIGKSYENMSEIHSSHDEAQKSMNAMFFTGSNSIIRYEDIQEYVSNDTTYPLAEEREVINSIATNKTSELGKKLDDFLNAIYQRNKSKDYHLKSSLALLFSIYHLCIEKNVDTNGIFGVGLSSLDSILQLDTLSLLKEAMLEIIEAAAAKISSIKNGNSIVELIIKLIDENYHNDLNLESIAREVYITPGYVSLLFKQTIGINFVDYLNKVRINKACELLKDIKFKMYQVSSRVGFNDEKYFSQIFKKYTGVTPTQYRESYNLSSFIQPRG